MLFGTAEVLAYTANCRPKMTEMYTSGFSFQVFVFSFLNGQCFLVKADIYSLVCLNPLQEDPFKVKTTVFNSAPQEMHMDPFQSEDPFKTDPFKSKSCIYKYIYIFIIPFCSAQIKYLPSIEMGLDAVRTVNSKLRFLFTGACVAHSGAKLLKPLQQLLNASPAFSLFVVGDPFQNDPFSKQASTVAGIQSIEIH